MDGFKKHIQERLGEMDTDVPPVKGWERINKEMFPAKGAKRVVISFPMRWAVAACIVLLAGIGVFVFNKTNNPVAVIAPANKGTKGIAPVNKIDSPTVVVAPLTQKENKPALAAANVPNETMPTAYRGKTRQPKKKIQSIEKEEKINLDNIESSFAQVIGLQKARVNSTPLLAESPQYFSDFGMQVKQMDKDEEGIKNEIKKHGLTNELLDQLINIYQQKLNVLKQLQNEMQKTNNRYKQGRKASDTQKRYFLNI